VTRRCHGNGADAGDPIDWRRFDDWCVSGQHRTIRSLCEVALGSSKEEDRGPGARPNGIVAGHSLRDLPRGDGRGDPCHPQRGEVAPEAVRCGGETARVGGLSGTFYVYFDSKEQFLQELLGQYVAFEGQTFPAPVGAETAFAGVRRFVGWYAQTFESNVGLLRCLVQLSSTDEGAHALWQARNSAVVERAFGDLMRRLGHPPADPGLLRLALRTAGGMLDQSLFTRYGLQASPGAELRRVDFDTLVELLSLLLHRAVYAADPPRHEIARVSALIGTSR
jgi:AcrR family transcriptional regulator